MKNESFTFSRQLPLAISLLITVWLASALVRVENERYALVVGMCRDKIGQTDNSCLRTVETRTSSMWHLFYALTGR